MEGREIIKFFSPELFIPKLKAKSKADSLDEFAQLFARTRVIRKKDIVLELLKQREKLGSTGIGKGVAIPHGRTTAAIELKIAFGKSEKGLDFDAMDKKPVHLIFVVIAPPQDENNRYLPILGKLVEILHESANRKKLLKAESFEEFVQIFQEAG